MQKCAFSGKGKQFGRNVSASLRRTPKTWQPNLQRKRLIVNGKRVRVKVSAHALRTLRKQGLINDPKKHSASTSSASSPKPKKES